VLGPLGVDEGRFADNAKADPNKAEADPYSDSSGERSKKILHSVPSHVGCDSDKNEIAKPALCQACTTTLVTDDGSVNPVVTHT